MFVFVWALIYHPTLTADNSKIYTSNVSGYPEGLICLKTMAKGKTAEGIQLNVSEFRNDLLYLHETFLS
jgi:hypothetical protein